MISAQTLCVCREGKPLHTFPDHTSKMKPAPEGAGKLKSVTPAYELAFSTVTARRFCDQQEMSLQTATGRSLP
jgi:hypothetical protein